MSTAIQRFLGVAELVSYVLGFMTWTETIRLSKISQAWRFNAQAITTVCIEQLLEHFIRVDHYPDFWRILHATNSAICSELPLLLLLNYPIMPQSVTPILEILIPYQQMPFLANFFRANGYIQCSNLPSSLRVRTIPGRERKVIFSNMILNVRLCFTPIKCSVIIIL